jgi:hypothetical protein
MGYISPSVSAVAEQVNPSPLDSYLHSTQPSTQNSVSRFSPAHCTSCCASHSIIEGLMVSSRARCNMHRGLNSAHIDPRWANCSYGGCGRGREWCKCYELNMLLLLLLLTLTTTSASLGLLLVGALSFGGGMAARQLWCTSLPSGFISGFALYSAKLLCGVPFVAMALLYFIMSSDNTFLLWFYSLALNAPGGPPRPSAPAAVAASIATVTPAVAALVRAHFRRSHQIHWTGGPHGY